MTDDDLIPNFRFLQGIADGPESQIDRQMADMVRAVLDKPLPEVRAGLHKALDFGARYGLCSDFVMSVLNVEWKRLGGKPDDPAPWRKEIEEREGL